MNFICFIFCKLLRIRKGRQPSDCLFPFLAPPSSPVHKQAQNSSRPAGMNFQSTCSRVRSLAVSKWERQEQKAQVSKKCDGRERRTIPIRLIVNCLFSPFGRAAPGAELCPRVVLLLCHSCFCCLLLFGPFRQLRHGKDSELFWNEQEKGGEMFGGMRRLL